MNERTQKALYIALSLLLAILFWFFVDNEQGNTSTVDFKGLPVEFIGETDTLPARGLMLSEGGDATVDLTLRGPRTVISAMRRQDIRLQVSLSSVNAVGRYSLRYEIFYADHIPENDITVEQRSVSSITVSVTELFSKTVPVDVQVTGDPGSSYIYMPDALVKEPASIIVSGREEDVASIAKAWIMVDLEGAEDTISRTYDYELLTTGGESVPLSSVWVSDKQVEVTAPIELMATLDLTVNWQEAPGSRLRDIRWTLSEKRITIAGDPDFLRSRTSLSLGEVDLSAYPMGRTEIELEIPIPAGCRNISGITKTTLTFSFSEELGTRLMRVTDITTKGLSPGQSVKLIAPSIEVLLRGPLEELEALTEEKVHILADLSQIHSGGNYLAPATVLVDGYSDIGPIGTVTVGCQITMSETS